MPPARAWRFLVLVMVGALVCACTPASDSATASRQRDQAPAAQPSAAATPVAGGTAVFGLAAEPEVLNPWLPAASASTALVSRPVLATLWRVLPDGTFEPWLLEGQPEVQPARDDAPFAVTYRIRRDATWSDGVPITGADVLSTLELCRDSRLGPQPPTDCEAVDLARSSANGKQVTVAFTRPYAAWRTVLSRLPVLPAHALAGRDRDPAALWARRLPLSSGPYRFSSWTPGRHIVLVRNERWWGPRPALDRLVFRTASQPPVQAIASGAIDIAEAAATPDTTAQADARADMGIQVRSGASWEALDFNVASPLLRRAEIRQALVQALDRQTIVDELLKPVDQNAQVRDDIGLTANTAPDAVPEYPQFDLAAARRALTSAGCAAGDDDVLLCAGQRLELDLVIAPPESSAAHPASEHAAWQHAIVAEYVRSHLAEVGARVNVLGAAPTNDDQTWDLRVAMVPPPADPAFASRRWRCGDETNSTGFCAPAFDALTVRAESALDPADRAGAYVDAAQLLAEELPTAPLYELPTVLVWSDEIQGLALNPGPWGATWNTEDWARTVR